MSYDNNYYENEEGLVFDVPSNVKPNYLSLVSKTSKAAGEWSGDSAITPGEFLASDGMTHGVALEVLPVAAPFKGRSFRNVDYTQNDICRSSDGVTPTSWYLNSELPMTDPRTGKLVYRTPDIQPHQRMNASNGMIVGGCAACPLGGAQDLWLKPEQVTQVDASGKPVHVAPPCQETATVLLFVKDAWVTNPEVRLQGNPLDFFRQNHADGTGRPTDDKVVKFFNVAEWNANVVYNIRSFAAMRSVIGTPRNGGQIPGPDGKPIRVPTFAEMLAGYVPGRIQNEEVRETLSRHIGKPERLMVFMDKDGNYISVRQAERLDHEPIYVGLRTIRMTTREIPNKIGMPSMVAVLSDGTSILNEGTPVYANYIEDVLRTKGQTLTEALGRTQAAAAPTFEVINAPLSIGGGETTLSLPTGEVDLAEGETYAFRDLLD